MSDLSHLIIPVVLFIGLGFMAGTGLAGLRLSPVRRRREQRRAGSRWA